MLWTYSVAEEAGCAGGLWLHIICAVGWSKGLCVSLFIPLVSHITHDCTVYYHVAYCNMLHVVVRVADGESKLP